MDMKKIFKPIFIRIFVLAFIINASLSVIPSNTISVFGFFGETIAETVQAEFVEVAQIGHQIYDLNTLLNLTHKQFGEKTDLQQLEQEWFVFLILLCICIYLEGIYSLPNKWTLITHKVRLDN